MPITRRDFINGSAVAIAGVSTGVLTACQKLQNNPTAKLNSTTVAINSDYPPALDKLRGSHQGSFDVAHEITWKGKQFDVANEKSVGDYDLVVVGAGISGLASAYWYQQQFPDSKILLIDNHDDFGGHAKRNEFHANVDGKDIFRISYGGTESIDSPKTRYYERDKKLLVALGIDVDKFEKFYDQQFFEKLNMQKGVYYNQAVFGKAKVVASEPDSDNAKADYEQAVADINAVWNSLHPSTKDALRAKQKAINNKREQTCKKAAKTINDKVRQEIYRYNCEVPELHSRTEFLKTQVGVVSYKPLPRPQTGYTNHPSSWGDATLSVVTSTGGNYWLKVIDADNRQEFASYFIRGGDTLDINLPQGSYELKYAHGDTWYGTKYLFGDDTSYAKADRTFEFECYSDMCTGYTVELIRQLNGNLSTTTLDPSQF